MNKIRVFVILFVWSVPFCVAQQQEFYEALSPYFIPPDSLKEHFGDFRSPLIFNNGKPVRTAKQWKKRKTEIKADWKDYLGKWSELYKKQKFLYLDTTEKNTYVQYTVRFKWTPHEWTQGYLLVPKERKGKMPAVVAVFYDAETSIGIGSESRPWRPHRDFAVQLANRGFVTLSIGTKAASERNVFTILPIYRQRLCTAFIHVGLCCQ